MENGLKGLMMAAGTIVTCLIISLGFFIAKEAKDSATNGAMQISKLNSEFIESDKIIYDSTQVSGSEVINVIRKYKTDTIGIKVETKKSTTDYNYVINLDSKSLNESDKKDYNTGKSSMDSDYINPTARFDGSVIRDVNGTIIGLHFVQVGA